MTNKKQNTLFIIFAYGIFWLILLAAVFVLLSGNEALFLSILPFVQIISTWAPTIALLVLFKKLYPDWTVKEFYKNAFKERLNFKIMLVYTLLYSFILFGIVGYEAITKGASFSSLLDYSFMGVIVTLFSGATGEESGWRGFLQPSVERKHSVIKASIIVGVIWAFWHAPTWFISGLAGTDLILYIILDILSKISSAVIIGVCYSRCRNLIIPVWIHFVSNMVMNGVQGVIMDYNAMFVGLQVLLAVGYVIWFGIVSKKETRSLKSEHVYRT